MNGPQPVQLRHPQALTAATAALSEINGSGPYGPYPFLTAALAALGDGDLDAFFEYAEGAARFTLLHGGAIAGAAGQVRFAFGIPDDTP